MNTQKRQERDAAICAAFVAGSRVSALAADYDLAAAHIRRILHAAGAWRTDRPTAPRTARPVHGPDGRTWPSRNACAAELGVSAQALYRHAEARSKGRTIVLRSYPQAAGRRTRKEAA